jgi:D-alanyl-D-alanine carboxypeptidase/D-alanyl-D-alanine-endopeptidase (penicillin-binding protein 4)
MRPAIDRILDDSILTPAFMGIQIVTADSGEVLYERNERKLFHPASNMKLLTTAASLRFLGSWYKFATTVGTDGTIRDSILDGNLIVRGCGDPLISSATLDSFATILASKGIRSISGDLVGDISAFDSLAWGEGWMWDDEPSTDAAFISPLTVNANSMDVHVAPGRKTGDRPRVSSDPAIDVFQIVNNAVTTNDTTLPELVVDRRKGENVVTLTGRMSPYDGERSFSFSVCRPEFYFLRLLRESLQRHNIGVEGSLCIDSVRSTTLLFDFENPIDSILHQINKPSDNLAAENLLKTLGAKMKGEPGSSAKGLASVREYLGLAGADTSLMILSDGSGLSFYDAISPRSIIALLLEQRRRGDTFPSFYESLPVAGVDGTLQNRMKGTAAQSNVHAKTGSLTGVSALSGYVTCADGTMLAVSILCNHFPFDIGTLRSKQNAIMELLAGSRLARHK